LSTKARKPDAFARACADALGFELVELDNWQCCGAVYPLGCDDIVGKLPSVRALVQAKKDGRALVTLCAACHHVLKRVNNDMRHDADLRAVVAAYDAELEYDGSVEVLHYLEVLQRHVGFDTIKGRVTDALKGRKIGAYYGCMLLRPSSIMAFCDPENPTIFEDFIRAVGAVAVVYPQRNECCGGYIALKEPEKSAVMAAGVAASAKGRGAQELITACPLCQYNVAQNCGDDVEVRYFTEILAEALGISLEGSGADDKN